MLLKPGCVVTMVRTNNIGKKTDSSGSGLLIDSSTIVSSASILLPIILQSRSLMNEIEEKGWKRGLRDVVVRVVVERINQLSKTDNVVTFNNYMTSLRTCVSEQTREKEIEFLDAELVDVFTCENFSAAFRDLFGRSNWSFDKNAKGEKNVDEDKTNTNKINKEEEEKFIVLLLSKFLVVKLRKDGRNRKHEIRTLFSDKPATIGERVEVCATPFGDLSPSLFMNSVSRGIVSNVYGKDNCLILTDARCIPGTEGGPVLNHRKQITGLVVVSLCWKNNEWIGLSIICSMQEILSSLQNSRILDVVPNLVCSRKEPSILKSFDDRVVMVKVGSTWGSGVIVHRDPTYIITCNHVINNHQFLSVSVKSRRGGNSIKCRVVHYHRVPNQFDIALLTISSQGHPVTSKGHRSDVKVVAPIEGQEVFVVGHALFDDKHDLHPTVTSGVVSRVTKVKDVPVMIQTTCAVNAGASGGALINQDGDLVGVVISNTRDSNSGADYPHVSMCIPAITIWPIIAQYLLQQDPSILNLLNIKNKMVAEIWSLGTQTKDSFPVSKL